MIVATAYGATLNADHDERLDPERLAAIPGAPEAVAAYLAANRTASARPTSAAYARAELHQLQSDGVAVPVLLAAARLADLRDGLALDAAHLAARSAGRLARLLADAEKPATRTA